MTASPRIVIIGAGLVGCALADALARRGGARVTVLDRGPLPGTGGATGHDAGLVRQLGPDRTHTRLATATRSAYAALRDAGRPVLTRSGSLEVAATADGLDELRHRHDRATAAGLDCRLLDPEECAARHPLLDPARVAGGLHVPGDGTVDPVAVARLYAAGAARHGAAVLGHRTVTALERSGGRVIAVRCADERHPADVVVCCAGVWTPAVTAPAGVTVPLAAVTGRYARTDALGALETIHALEAASGRADPALPVLVDAAAGVAIRTHGHRIGIAAAPDRHRGTAVSGGTAPAAPRSTPEDLDPAWDVATALLPLLRDAKVAEGVDGLVAATPDGAPLLGEHPDLPGLWIAGAVPTACAAGAAEVLAEWIGTGRPALHGAPLDLSGMHLDRFEPGSVDPSTALPLAVGSPFHSRQVELRARFAPAHDPAPAWFGANAALPEVCEIPRPAGAGEGAPVAGAEALIARRAAGMTDLSAGRRVEVTGPGAAGFLQQRTTGDVDRPVGEIVETLLLDDDGGLLAAPRVTRLGADRFLVGLADRLQVAELRRAATGRAGDVGIVDVGIVDVSAVTACLGLRGPHAGAILGALAAGGAPGPGRAGPRTLGAVATTVLRPRDGCWEIVCAAADAERLWDAVRAAGAPYGLAAVGRTAADALRVEDADPRAGAEISAEHGPDAVGLGDRVDPAKPAFPGRAAVLALRAAGGPAERLVTLVLDHAGALLRGGEPVYDLPRARRHSRDPVLLDGGAAGAAGPDLRRGPVIGRVTAAVSGHTTGTALARAWLPAVRAAAGTRVGIELAGRSLTARVAAGPLDRQYSPTA
ncbi:FAD-dependent oxidoreductase [Pseudonocardia sp. HH130630-07]|uniref:FAD-dependent oxidoreductase n=1 Tax=Pseudonocardia sp. HH130630-07 TaxID=1690815 RepID=UPI0008153476|nr:FAD-dependent oxidoreductase [Pseudonocardia sp. HH130630-07]ANY09613.1 hypothetical protein AFB00_29055 [Pseudonocardia sp. HH130630-07]